MSMVNEWQHLKIPFHEIEVATENFKTFIGRGGYGSVFKGKLLVSGKETIVAVKRLNEQFGQGLKEFLTEIQLLYGQQHPNLISLVGFCDQGREKCIVYEYAERGSLDQYVRRTRKTTSTTLTWLQRLKICTDAARGLDHLHSHVGAPRMIIHRDIKSSNILIDENWVAKISDLGLSKLTVSGFGMSEIVSNSCGTRGYCEPEYHTTGIVTKKSDVYSFGVVLFEVLCGRLCLIDSDDGFSLSSISAKKYYKNNTLDKIIDQSLREHMGSYSMTKFAAIAYRCLDDDRKQRPAMDVVVKELEEALKYQEEYDLDSLIKMFKIPPNKNELLSYLQNLIDFDGGYKGDGSETSGATVGVNGNYNNNGGDCGAFEKDGLLWYKDIGKHYGGEYSMAVVQGNQVLEDQSQIESGLFGTFVGVYDGHGGPDVARYICDNLFRNFQAITAENHGVVTPDTIKNAYLQTENGFTSLVAELFNERPGIATVGSCCLVGVIYQQTLFAANLGDARVVLGKKVGNTGGMVAIQLSSEHNANLEEVRHELKSLHPHDPNIVALKHGVWRVKGIIQLSRSIGDVYMKHSEYNNDQIAYKFRLPESTVMPILSATPSILTHDIDPSDSFLIFASDGLWEHLSNEEAVKIVHNNPRAGIAKRLVKAALHEAASKRELTYSELRSIDKRVRRHFHDDITAIVLFLNYDQISRGRDGIETRFDLVHLQKIIQNEERNLFGPGAFRKNRGFLQKLTLRPKISWVSRDTPRPTAANGPNVSLRSALEH